MSDCITLVLVRMDNGKPYLFRAPAYARIGKGTLVKVETACGEKYGEVIASGYFYKGSNEYKFAMEAFKATEPLKKVISKKVVSIVDFDYEDE